MTTFSVESKSQLAKLLATENLTIQHQKIRTAKFDPTNRVLYCPIWKDMSGDLYDLLMGHEVGHALETPADGWHEAVKEGVSKKYKHFLNVVEDARIEKKIKRRYPGLRASFVRGYKNLLDRDFFGIADRDVNTLPFIDRLNLYTKGGTLLGIEFNAEETEMLRRVESCETWQDVLNVTASVYEYSKTEQQQMQEQEMASTAIGSGDYDEYEDDYEYDYDSYDENEDEPEDTETGDSDESADEDDEGGKQNVGEKRDVEEKSEETKNSSNEETDKSPDGEDTDVVNKLNRWKDSTESYHKDFEPVCSTDETFRENESQLLNEVCKEYVYANIPTPNMNQILTPYNRVHEQLEEKFKEHQIDSAKLYNDFKSKNERYISLLAKEFEMRKAARSYSKTKTSVSGDIDISRLWKYQVDDNIFKKLQRTPKGKSHGLVMLLDRSGSMTDNMAGSLEQIMVLASFCRKVNIPFVLYGFGDCEDSRRIDFPNELKTKCFSNNIGELNMSNMYLREYLNSRMGNAEFTRCMRNLAALKKSYESRYSRYLRPDSEHLSNTPLLQAMVAMKNIVQDFRKVNNLDLVNMVVVHDGDADSCDYVIAQRKGYDGSIYLGAMPFDNRRQNVVIRDVKNKIEIQLRSEGPNHQYDDALRAGLFKWFSKVTGAKIFGFFITGGNRSTKFAVCNKYIDKDGRNVYDMMGIDRNANYVHRPDRSEYVSSISKMLTKDKFVESFNEGYTAFYMIPGGEHLRVVDEELNIDGKVTAGKLKNAFMKVAKAKQVNRVLVSRFIQGIAA